MQSPVKINVPPRDRGHLRRILLLDVVLPQLAVVALESLFSEPAILAFAISGLFPAASILASWIEFCRADWIGIVILSTLVGGLITAFFTGKIEFAAIKAAPLSDWCASSQFLQSDR